MKKKIVMLMLATALTVSTVVSGCGNQTPEEPVKKEEVVKNNDIAKIKKHIKNIDKLAVIENAKNIDLDKVVSDMVTDKEKVASLKVDTSKVNFNKAGKYPVEITLTEKVATPSTDKPVTDKPADETANPTDKPADETTNPTDKPAEDKPAETPAPKEDVEDTNKETATPDTNKDNEIKGTVDIEIIDKDKVDEALKDGNIIIGDDNKVIENDKTDSESDKDDKKDDDKKETDDNLVAKDDKKPSKPENKPNKPSEKPNKPSKPETKPENKPSKPDSKPSKPDSKPSKPENKPSKHEHDWKPVYKTVHHKEESHYETIHHDEVGHTERVLVEEGWTEEVSEIHTFCNECKKDLTASGEDLVAHGRAHALAGEGTGGHHTGQVITYIEHPDVYDDKWVVDKAAWDEQKKVVDKAAWDEQVIDYYKCSCGATK